MQVKDENQKTNANYDSGAGLVICLLTVIATLWLEESIAGREEAYGHAIVIMASFLPHVMQFAVLAIGGSAGTFCCLYGLLPAIRAARKSMVVASIAGPCMIISVFLYVLLN